MLKALIQILESLQQALEHLGGWGYLVYAGIFLGLQCLLFPCMPMAIAAGFFFGFGRGWFALHLGCFLGATVNFWLARSVARDWVQNKFGSHEKFRLIDRAIGREGWKIVALLRLVPIPYGLSNYSFGLTPVRYVPYIIATMVMIQPANSLFLWIGATSQGELASVLNGRHRHPLEYVVLAVGMIAAFVVMIHMSRIAHAAVNKSDSDAQK